MGTGASHLSQLDNNDLLLQLSGHDHLPPSDGFWPRLLSFHLTPPTNNEEQLTLDGVTEAYLQKLVTNNPRSGNIASLVQVFITRATDFLASPSANNVILSWQTLNALLVVRCVTKFLVENVSESVLRQHLYSCWEPDHNHGALPTQNSMDMANGNLTPDPQSQHSQPETPQPGESPVPELSEARGNGDVTPVTPGTPARTLDGHKYQDGPVEMLIDALFGLIIDVPVTDNSYYLHLEAINTLLVLLSVHLFSPSYGDVSNVDNSQIYRTVFGGRYSLHAALLVRALLRDVAAMTAPPPPPATGSIVLGLASSIWSLMSGSHWRADPVDTTSLRSNRPAASQACLLILVLANHSPSSNLYREALFSCQDVQQAGALGVEFGSLYTAMGNAADAEHITLLLYLLLHRNQHFRGHLLARPDLQTLVVPIMKTLYDAPSSSSHHIYMSLIVLLILSEDDNFNRSIHETMLKNITWYTERTIPEISIGGLLILVIVRTIQFNMLRSRDKYLHTNCLAALANMSSEFRNLHPYVAQRIVSLFETLSKKHTRLVVRVHRPQPPSTSAQLQEQEAEASHEVEPAEEALTEEITEELLQDIAVVEEVLRMVLEIINSCVSCQLRSNIHLVYSLLHKRALFQRYRGHAHLNDLIQNIEMVVGYFSARLQRAQEQRGALGAAEVLAVITRAADHWSNDRLRKFPDLKFRYVEEDQPEEFFTPYVWSLICAHGAIRWSIDPSLLPDLSC